MNFFSSELNAFGSSFSSATCLPFRFCFVLFVIRQISFYCILGNRERQKKWRKFLLFQQKIFNGLAFHRDNIKIQLLYIENRHSFTEYQFFCWRFSSISLSLLNTYSILFAGFMEYSELNFLLLNFLLAILHQFGCDFVFAKDLPTTTLIYYLKKIKSVFHWSEIRTFVWSEIQFFHSFSQQFFFPLSKGQFIMFSSNLQNSFYVNKKTKERCVLYQSKKKNCIFPSSVMLCNVNIYDYSIIWKLCSFKLIISI